MATAELVFAHVGVAVPDLRKAAADYRALLGYDLLSGPFDDPTQKVSVCFLGHRDGDRERMPVVELIAPLGEESPVKRLLSKGGGAYHLAYYVRDIGAWVAEARGKGCVLLGEPVPAVAYSGRKIAWLYLPSRQLVEVIERG
jgi:methylmalonyl-CoA/ethylmalonyl-CoA epimerase